MHINVLEHLTDYLHRLGGGQRYEEEFGRLCFCGSCGFDEKGPWQNALHSELCDELNATIDQARQVLAAGEAVRPPRVFYKTREPFQVAEKFIPGDFEAMVVVFDAQVLHSGDNVERVFEQLNADDRPGGRSFRSMSVGDIAEVNGQMHQCLFDGWRSVPPCEANALRARFGLVEVAVV